MSLTRAHTISLNFASRKFTNRENHIELVAREKTRLFEVPSYFRVVTFYGIGGVGKTTLLKHVRKLYDERRITWVHVDLESGSVNSPIDALYEIYRESKLKYFPFEYALAKVWLHKGRDIGEIRNRLISAGGAISDLGDVALEAISSVINIKGIRRIFDTSTDAIKRRSRQNSDLIQYIDTLENSEIERQLPQILSLAINKEKNKNTKYIFSVDSLDSLTRKPGFSDVRYQYDDWLNILIGEAKTGVWLLAGRERLTWADEMPEWESYYEDHLIGELSEQDTLKFLREIPVDEPEIEKAILNHSNGIPIILDIAASLYLAKKHNNDTLEVSDFQKPTNDTLNIYFSHLDKDHADAIRCLALLDEFDQELAIAAMSAWNLRASPMEFRAICGSIMALSLEDGLADFRIHSIIREAVARSVPLEDVCLVFESMLLYMSSFSFDDLQKKSWWFARCLVFALTHRVIANTCVASEFLSIGYELIEAGGFIDFGFLIDAMDKDWSTDSEELQTAAKVLQSYLLRRRGKLDRSKKSWNSIRNLTILTPRVQGLVAYLRAHTDHLRGDYIAAKQAYSELIESSLLIKEKHFAYSVRQLADINMLQGNFEIALSQFKKSFDMNEDSFWKAETLRHIGHVYRHNHLYQEAREYYKQSQTISEQRGYGIMLAKLETNYLELECFANPVSVVNKYLSTIEENKNFENDIEIGKCFAAASFAFALENDITLGLSLAKKALEVQESTGYQSGQLFALCAKSFNLALCNNLDEWVNTVKDIEILQNKLQVYPYYNLPSLYIVKKPSLLKLKNYASWIDINRTHLNLSALKTKTIN